MADRGDWQNWCAGLDGNTKVVGVFGWPVEHSLSTPMHNAAFATLGLNWVYVPFPVVPEELGAAIDGARALGIRGINVTIPHKHAITAFVDVLDETASAVEAANTIDIRDGILTAYNTDGPGFVASMREIGWTARGLSVTLVGAGGVARAIAAAMVGEGASRISILNRTVEKAEALIELVGESASGVEMTAGGLEGPSAKMAVGEADVVVDCTSVGMYPYVNVAPVVPQEWLHDRQLVCDLTYNPRETVLLRAGRAQGAAILDGTGMLVHQGAIAFEIWTEQAAPVGVMREALLGALSARMA